MKVHVPAAILVSMFASISVLAQTTVIINLPNEAPAKSTLSAAEQKVMDKNILPKVRKKLAGESCEESVDVAGVVRGAFTRAGADQTLIFYQFCQTGNGLGSTGVALIENGKAVGSWVSAESGWTMEAKALPDINQNGVNEVAFYYSGGMHQGEGGTGVDIMEFSGNTLTGIGWFQAEGFTEKTDNAYKVTVKTGRMPTFYREKWIATRTPGKYRKLGNPLPLKLKPVFGSFEAVK